jgi:hypothetical protein
VRRFILYHWIFSCLAALVLVGKNISKVFFSLFLRKMPFYAVRQGRKTGIYQTWLDLNEFFN